MVQTVTVAIRECPGLSATKHTAMKFMRTYRRVWTPARGPHL